MELVQSEDVIEALLDYFVSPLLPRRKPTNDSLTDDQQILMAKQMHAVVILYNYYHRKQFSCHKFIDFESFCKVSCMSKPGLVPYLRSVHECDYKSENLSNQYKITKKKVMDACNICISLDPSKENPTVDAWPISKVAIFLVDSKKENCALLYNYSIQGVWSLVESEVACCDNKLLQTESYESEKELEHLAFSSVEKDTGISVENLNILERHIVYSLSHEKTVARLYIMKFKGTTVKKEISQVSIKVVKTSLEGPVVQDSVTSAVVEYYNILPYYEIISRWLSRQNNQQVEENEKVSLNTTKDLKVKIKYVTIKPKNDVQTNKPSKSNSVIETKNKSVDSNSMSSRSRSLKSESVLSDKKQEIEVDSGHIEKSISILSDKKQEIEVGSVHIEKSMRDDTKLENKANSPSIQLKKPSSEMTKLVNDRQLQQKQVISVKEKNKLNDDDSKNLGNKVKGICIPQEKLSFKKDNLLDNRILQKDQDSKFVNMPTNNLLKDANTYNKGADELNGATNYSNLKDSKQSINENDGLQAGLDEKKVNTESKIITETNGLSTKNVTYPSSNRLGTKDIVENVEALCSGPENSQYGEENMISNIDLVNGDHHFDCAQRVSVDGVADEVKSVKDIIEHEAEASTLENLQLVLMQPNSTDYDKLYHALESKENDLMQATLHILQNKLDEMQQQKHLLDDKIVGCEMNIQMILNEGVINGTVVESIIRALNSHCPNPLPNDMNSFPEDSQTVKRRKLSEVVLSLRSSCQELENICRRSCWILPRYTVIPSFQDHEITGLFKATVELHGADFEFRSDGDEKSSPSEARESAAYCMLTKLRNC